MQVTFNIADTLTANIRGTMVERDLTALPTEALVYIFQYGFQRINNDSAGQNKGEDAVANSDKKWKALTEGKIRASSTRTTDELGKECRRVAAERVDAAAKAKGVKLDADNRKALVAKLAATEAIINVAKANLATMAEIDIDLDF